MARSLLFLNTPRRRRGKMHGSARVRYITHTREDTPVSRTMYLLCPQVVRAILVASISPSNSLLPFRFSSLSLFLFILYLRFYANVDFFFAQKIAVKIHASADIVHCETFF